MATRKGERDSHFGCEEMNIALKRAEGDVLYGKNITSPERF